MGKASGASRVAEGNIRSVGEVDVTVGVGLEPFLATLVRVFGGEGTGGKNLSEEGCPGGVQSREGGLEGLAGKKRVAGYADEGAEVAVEFESWEEGMGEGVEGVDILGYHASEHSHFPQVSDGPVGIVRPRVMEIGPSEE